MVTLKNKRQQSILQLVSRGTQLSVADGGLKGFLRVFLALKWGVNVNEFICLLMCNSHERSIRCNYGY